MLKRQNRITENREYLRIFKTVRPVHTEHLALRCTQRNSNFKSLNSKQFQNTKSQISNNNETMSRSAYGGKQSNNERSASRFGFVVSNKIDKRSARRNGLKRRIRAVIELNLAEIKQPVDVVIQVKKAFDYPYNFKNIQLEVLEGLSRTGVVSPRQDTARNTEDTPKF